LDVTPKTIRNWANGPNDPLPAKRVKGVLLLDCEAVGQWLKQHQYVAVDVDAMVDEILSGKNE